MYNQKVFDKPYLELPRRPVLKQSLWSDSRFLIDLPVCPIWSAPQDQEISQTHFEEGESLEKIITCEIQERTL